MLLFALIGLSRFRSVSAAPAVVLAVVGVVVGFAGAVAPGIVATMSLVVTLGYVFWYSRLGRGATTIGVGTELPELDFSDLDGRRVSSVDWRGSPTILLFYRGNWCPLCNVQVKELAAGYREIEDRGAKVVLVSPQSAEQSSQLAAKFDAPMSFLVDDGNTSARRLGIQHPGGTPVVVSGYDAESVLPTAIVLDADNIVRFAHETDNYRVRPDPALFLDVLGDLEPA